MRGQEVVDERIDLRCVSSAIAFPATSSSRCRRRRGCTAPVTYAPARLARKIAAPAMSSGRPMRPSGDDRAIVVAEVAQRRGHHLRLERSGRDRVHRDVLAARAGARGGGVNWWIAALLDEYEYVSSIGTWIASIEPMLITRAGSSAVAGRLELRQQRPGEEERRLHVEVEHLVPRVGRELGERRAPGGARVVHEDVRACPRARRSRRRGRCTRPRSTRSAGRLTQVPTFESSAATSSHTSFLRDEM